MSLSVSLSAKNMRGAMDLSAGFYNFLEKDWRDSKDYRGVYRPGYSAQENDAFGHVVREANKLGGRAYKDLGGNLHVHFMSDNPNLAPMMMGSHMDAVPRGGRYDGTAGIVAALAALRALQDNNLKLAQDVILTVFRAEESAWWDSGTFGIGSKLMTGKLTPEFLDKAQYKETGETLSERMQMVGVSPHDLSRALKAGKILFPIDMLQSYTEVHIEQGPLLLDKSTSLGIISDIRGHTRFPKGILFKGKTAHSGATPQYLRRDAVLGAAQFVSEWEKAMFRLSHYTDLVYAVPDFKVINASSTSVPGLCSVMPEVRSTDLKILTEVKNITKNIAEDVARKYGLEVDVNFDDINISNPSKMDSGIHNRLMQSARKLGVKRVSMASGAVHDASTMADSGVPSTMILIRHGNEGISHSPDEILGRTKKQYPFDLKADFCKAVQLIAYDMANADKPRRNNGFPITHCFGDYCIKNDRLVI